MTQALARPEVAVPTFNLWDEPWIGVVLPDGSTRRVGIREALVRAPELCALYDQSPLVVAGTQRLLAAILQDMVRPRRVADIAALLRRGRFDSTTVAAYADRYYDRFDLFSPDAPFLQTSDAPLRPGKGDQAKWVAGLFFEEPSGTNVIHFRHAYEDEQAVCPACAAGGLVTQPAFATSGGAGIRPSINGVPPVYVLPAGANLFETLTFSLVTPDYQPASRDPGVSAPPWMLDDTVIRRNEEVNHVGYLQSLLFPARRVRLQPQQEAMVCSRCGSSTKLPTRMMVYEMGRSRPAGSPLWQDPFAAYRKREGKEPTPLRPQAGKALWREYSTLFLSRTDTTAALIPSVVQQLTALAYHDSVDDAQLLRFRCIGLRTDMKAKIFEWMDESLDVPVGLLHEPRGARQVQLAIERAEQCEQDLNSIFARYFRPGGESAPSKREPYKALRERMAATYWTELAPHFREFVLLAADPGRYSVIAEHWLDMLLPIARRVFEETLDDVGDRGDNLRRRVEASHALRIRLAGRRKEWLYGNDTNTDR